MSTSAAPREPDERHGLPSASKAEVYAECPNSLGLCNALAEAGQHPGGIFAQEAAFGTLVHSEIESRLNGEGSTSTDPEVCEMADTCLMLAEPVMLGWLKECKLLRFPAIMVERRAWLMDANDTPLGSAKFDVGIRGPGGRLLLIDWKTGFVAVDDAGANWQMAAQAACAASQFGATRITVVVVQPRTYRQERVMSAVYEGEGLVRAAEEIAHVFRNAMAGNAAIGFRRGIWCRTCPAALACPAVRDLIRKMAGLEKGEAIQLPSADLVEIQQLKSTLERVGDDASDELLKRIDAGEVIEGVTVQKRNSWKLTDPDGAAAAIGMPVAMIREQAGEIRSGKFLDLLASLGLDESKIDSIKERFGFASSTRFVKSTKRKRIGGSKS